MYRLLARGVLWGVGSSVGVIALQLALTLVVGRQSTELLGLLNLIEVVNAGFVAAFFFGGGVTLTNFINRSGAQSSLPVVAANLLFAMVCVSLGLIGAGALGVALPYSAGHAAMLVTAGLLWLTFNQLAVERAARFQFGMSNLLEKGGNLLVPLVLIVVALAGSLDAAVVLTVVLFIYALIAAYGLLRAPRPETQDWRQLPVYYRGNGAFLTATYVIIFVYERIDQILILHYFDLTTLGIYYISYKMSFSVRLLATIIVKAAYPLMSSLEHGGRRGLSDLSLTLLRLNYVIATTAAVGLTVGAEFLLGLYGQQYVPYASVLIIMAVTRVCGMLNLVLGNVINAKSAGGAFLTISVSTVLLQVVVLVVLVDPLGVDAMALSRLAAVILGSVLSALAVQRLGELTGEMLRISIKHIVFATATAIAVATIPGALTTIAIMAGLLFVIGSDLIPLWRLWQSRNRSSVGVNSGG